MVLDRPPCRKCPRCELSVLKVQEIYSERILALGQSFACNSLPTGLLLAILKLLAPSSRRLGNLFATPKYSITYRLRSYRELPTKLLRVAIIRRKLLKGTGNTFVSRSFKKNEIYALKIADDKKLVKKASIINSTLRVLRCIYKKQCGAKQDQWFARKRLPSAKIRSE